MATQSKWKKTALIIGVVAISVFLAYKFFGTSDLRISRTSTSSDEVKGRALLKEMGVAHGISQWEDVDAYSVVFEDEFYGLIGQNTHPYKENKSRFQLQYIANSYDGRLTFLSGDEKHLTWGIQAWKTYTAKKDAQAEFGDDIDIQFWLPTYQYFIEFPLRIQTATAVSYMGESTINGISCDGILASWNTIAPQKDIDQYLIWLDKKTRRIVKLEYTVREMYTFLTGAAFYENYQEYEGLILPAKMPVESNLVKDAFLHEMRIINFSKNAISKDEIRPDKTLPIFGDSKPDLL